MLSKLLNFFKPHSDPPPVISFEEQRARRLEKITQELANLESPVHSLSDPMKQTCERFLFYAKLLATQSAMESHLTFLERYVPHAFKIIESHVKWRLEYKNDLQLLWSLTQSKAILIRLANALQEQSASLEQAKNLDFKADMAALDNILKISGY